METFISVDIETSGPIPGKFSLLCIGACLVDNESVTFEQFVKPTTQIFDPEALEVIGLSLEDVDQKGLTASAAMALFRDWVESVAKGSSPVFVGFNASFDWAFVNYYFHQYVGANPFGFAALDIKSMFFGKYEVSWADTRSSRIAANLNIQQVTAHNALEDALYQAKLFRMIRELSAGECHAK